MNSIAHKYNRSLILLFVFAPFVAFFTIRYLDMSFNRIMQLLSYIGVFLVLLFRTNKTTLKFPNYLIFYLLFILFVFYSDLIRLERDFKIEYLFSNKYIGSFNMMFIIENLNISKKNYKSYIKYSKIILKIAVIVILIQQVYDPNFFMRPWTFDDEFYSGKNSTVRLYSIYSWFGSIKSAGFSFIPVFLIVFEDRLKHNKTYIHWLVMGLIFVFLSKQRWMMVNFSVVFVLIYLNSNNEMKIIQSLRLVVLIPMMVVGLFLITNFIGIDTISIVKERILESDKRDMSQKTAGTRLLAFKAFNHLYWDNAIYGVGNIKYGMGGTGKQEYKLRSFLKGRSSQIHVGYLNLLYMYGVIGGFLFLSFFILLLRKLYKNAKTSKIWAPFLGVIGVALDNLFDVHYDIFIMGLIIAIVTARFYALQESYINNEYAR